jgi:osmotically-inducible protein OsmY
MTGSASDAQLQAEVVDALRYDVRIDETNITVDVTNGVVRLSGTVPTYFQKMTAGHDVQRIKGVRRVVNDLEVRPVTAWTDVEIGRVIRSTLDHDARIVDPSAIDVVVADGVVTLNGTVGSPAERAYAAGDAWVAPGVVNVVNNLTIIPAQRRNDAEIAADVRQELSRDPFLHPANIDVQVTNGVVYLRGTVPSDFDAHEAQHDTWRVAGIRDVVNELRVAA